MRLCMSDIRHRISSLNMFKYIRSTNAISVLQEQCNRTKQVGIVESYIRQWHEINPRDEISSFTKVLTTVNEYYNREGVSKSDANKAVLLLSENVLCSMKDIKRARVIINKTITNTKIKDYLIEECNSIVSCDRVLKNQETLIKRIDIYNVVKECKIVDEESTIDCIYEICRVIDEINMDFNIKYNLCIENIMYTLDKLVIKLDRATILEAVSDYFLARGLSEAEYCIMRDIIQETVYYDEVDKDLVDFIVKDDDLSIEPTDIIEEGMKVSKVKDMINKFKIKKNKSPNDYRSLLSLMYANSIDNIIDETPNYLSWVRQGLIFGSLGINIYLGAVTIMVDKFIQKTVQRRDNLRFITKIKNEIKLCEKKIEKARTDATREKLEKYVDNLNKNLSKLETYNDNLYSDRELSEREVSFESAKTLLEGYVKSQEDLIANFDNWKKEKGKNILYITGLSGSGKTTLGAKYKSEYNAVLFGLDAVYENNPNYNKTILNKVRKEYPRYDEIFKNSEELTSEILTNECDFLTKVAKRCIQLMKEDYNTLYIVEGIQIFEHLKLKQSDPLIIKGTSMLKSIWRRWERNGDGRFNILERIKYTFPELFGMYVGSEKQLRKFRKELIKEGDEIDMDNIIEENEIEKIIPLKETEVYTEAFLDGKVISKKEYLDNAHQFVVGTAMMLHNEFNKIGDKKYRELINSRVLLPNDALLKFQYANNEVIDNYIGQDNKIFLPIIDCLPLNANKELNIIDLLDELVAYLESKITKEGYTIFYEGNQDFYKIYVTYDLIIEDVEASEVIDNEIQESMQLIFANELTVGEYMKDYNIDMSSIKDCIDKYDNQTIELMTEFSLLYPNMIEPSVLKENIIEEKKNAYSRIKDNSVFRRTSTIQECVLKIEDFEANTDNKNRYQVCNEFGLSVDALNAVKELNLAIYSESSITTSLKMAKEKLKKATLQMSDKEKMLSRQVDNYFDKINLKVQKELSNKNREAVIRGSVLPSASSIIKIAMTSGALALVNPALSVIAIIGGIAASKVGTKREKQFILDEIDIQLKLVEKKIQLAESNNDMKSLEQLLKIEQQLKREKQRIIYKIRTYYPVVANS